MTERPVSSVQTLSGAAIVSNSPLQRRRLQDAIGKFGLDAQFTGDPDRLLGLPTLPEARLWLVALEDEADHPRLFDHLLENTNAPILFGLDEAPQPGTTDYFRWERRLVDKLEVQLGTLEQLDGEVTLKALDVAPEVVDTPARPQWIPAAEVDAPARQIWVLGASLGGPAAVKAFLDHLPASLPVGFVYAQHIDNNFTDVLARVLGRHASYKLRHAEPGYQIRNTDVVLMPVDQEWVVDHEGRLQPGNQDWPGPYGPSIDQVLFNLAAYYQEHCHAVLFSGMGNDGAIAAPQLSRQGSRVWVQSSASCGNSSMPESVAETGCVSFTGNPVELAAKLVRTIEETCLLDRRQRYGPPEKSDVSGDQDTPQAHHSTPNRDSA